MSNCKLCDNFILTQAVTWNGTSLVLNLPAGSYNNNQKYCIVVTQAIPSATLIGAPVVITIGTGLVQYPVVLKNCRPMTACKVGTRTKYPMVLETTSTGGVFRVVNKPCCANRDLSSVNGTAPTT